MLISTGLLDTSCRISHFVPIVESPIPMQTLIRQTLRNSGSFKDSSQNAQHISAWPRPFTEQTSEKPETKLVAELPLPPSSRSPHNFIYTTFASYVTWLLQAVFFWRRSTFWSVVPYQEPAQEVKLQMSATPSEEDSAQEWKLQMLMVRRKREAERARHNPNVVVTFSGLAEVGLSGGAEKRKRDDLSEDDDGAVPLGNELPWHPRLPPPSSSPVLSCAIMTPHAYAESNHPKYTSLLSDCPPLSRCASPCSSEDSVWDERDAEPQECISRCASPWSCDDSGDESDAELQECIRLIFEDD
ncbi:hypothetical protein B0H19DRAFT_1125256 [Mycena capillaripes]|nr:hypothetical protein B0H19DRAFT_1125256 [Mycena capillaripes]